MEYITTQRALERLVPAVMSQKAWGLDTETTGLDPHTNRVTLMQIGDEHAQYVIDTRKVNIEPLRPFLESKNIKKLGHNLKFDYKMIRGTFGIETEGLLDTYIGERLLVNGKKVKYGFGLDDVLEMRGILSGMDKTLQQSFISHNGEFSQAQLEYAARDVQYTLPHARALQAELIRDGQLRTWGLECDVLPAFGDMEFCGQILDIEKWKQNISDNEKAAIETKAELDNFVAPFCPRNMFGEIDTISYDSSKQLLDLLRQMNIKVKVRDEVTKEETEKLIFDTSKDTQKKLRNLPIIKLLEKYRAAKKRVGTYGVNYLEAVHPKTGRIHPEVDQIGTGTGRPANRGAVSFLNIPRDNRYRNSLIALPGWVIETDDYSGCELRILAEFSGEESWIRAFLNKEDMHCVVATELYGVPVTKSNENKKLRTPAKSLNFGWCKLSRNKTYSIQGNPTVQKCTGAILSESTRNSGSVQRLTAQTDRLRTGYAKA